MKKVLCLILSLLMLLCVFASCDFGGGTETESKTETPTEIEATEGTEETEPKETEPKETEPKETEPKETEPKESESTPNTDTDPVTESDTEPETETETGVHFKDDFMIAGEYASEFKAALKAEKIKTGKTNSENVIYVGKANAEIVNTAKANITRPNSYNDYTIITDGKNLAIYATSDYAVELAIDYLIENYTEGGHVAVPDNFAYTSQKELSDIKIGGNTVDKFTVVAADNLQDIASGLAKDLTLKTGYTVAHGTSAEGAKIVLAATGAGNTVQNSYTVTYSDSALTLTAANKVTLAYAVSGLLAKLEGGLNITDGFSETYTLETKTVAATDTALFKYCGTWQATDSANPTTMVSYWDAAYVEIDFTGNAITLMFSSATTFMVRVDGGEYTTVSNHTGDYTVYAADGGTHTVRVLYNDKDKNMYFAGVKAGSDVTLSRTPDKKYYIQFVGDSISDATNSFSHNSAEILDWDYSVIACEALSLVRDMGYWRYNNGFNGSVLTEGSMAWHFKENFGVTSVGMEDAYFKLGIPNKWKPEDPRFSDVAANYYTEKYDFDFNTGNTPDIVFIFLGTNDISLGSSSAAIETFKKTYVSFVEKLFELYGKDVEIVVMQSLSTSIQDSMYDTSHPRFTAIREVAGELVSTYPNNVTFLDENTIFSWGIDISADGTHPSQAGYAMLSEEIAEWLSKKFK